MCENELFEVVNKKRSHKDYFSLSTEFTFNATVACCFFVIICVIYFWMKMGFKSIVEIHQYERRFGIVR